MFRVAFIGLLLLIPSCRQEALTKGPNGEQVVNSSGKVSGDLIALQQEYASRRRVGMGAFVPSNPALTVIGERVVVDAVAAEDTGALYRDLQAIGASNITAVGRTVSAQIPIEAITDLDRLESLKSVRASYGQVR